MVMSECWAGPDPEPAIGFVLMACYISRPGSGLMMSNKDNMNPFMFIGFVCAQLTKPVNSNDTNLGVVSLPSASFALFRIRAPYFQGTVTTKFSLMESESQVAEAQAALKILSSHSSKTLST